MVNVKPTKLGRNVERMDFSKINEVLKMPNLLELQTNSYKWFLDEGLKEVFKDVSGITDYSGNLVLDFVDYHLDSTPNYKEVECKARDATYAAPLSVKARLYNKQTGEVKDSTVYMGDFPLMTDSGTFIINGAERVIVSQLVRSPGVYYKMDHDKTGKELFSTTVIPNRGAWLEYENDINDIFYVRIDKNRKIPVTIFIRALGLATNEEIIEYFGDDERINRTLEKDTTTSVDEALIEVYKKLRPGEPPSVEGSQTHINGLFFDSRRYDLSKVGRYKYNKKLAIGERLIGKKAFDTITNPRTGEIIVEKDEVMNFDKAMEVQASGVSVVTVITDADKQVKIISNGMVDLKDFVSQQVIDEVGITEKVRFTILCDILDECEENEEELIRQIKEKVDELVPKHIIKDDIFATINYFNCLACGIGLIDDIDHLGNRRIRSVGELLQNQMRIGFSRLERIIHERMILQASEIDAMTPANLINIRPVLAAIREFFGSSPLSQFMDQNNPLAELTHKRRLSALGPGGLSRDRASFDVRDVHYTHYARMCPVETPEGPNVGLISYLATFARVNDFGFIEAPYRKVVAKEVTDKDGNTVVKHVVTDEVQYMTADQEDEFIVAQANEPLDENGCFARPRVNARYRDSYIEIENEKIDFMDVCPRQVVSVATCMIPFLENDDANRALMGANMQRQAVPLLKTEAPFVGTGMEFKAGVDSGVCIVAKNGGIVKSVSADLIEIKTDDNGLDTYEVIKFLRSNQGTCINQVPIVNAGERIEKGDVLADGPATKNGEIAIGKNALIGFMTWEGYNYEDAVLLNERMVREDIYTSVHITEYELEARNTKLGPEDITRDIPNVGEEPLRDLDENGVIRIGAEVHAGDILVGKVTPKGETELTAEERLLRAIFGEKAREVRDTSLRVPHGEYGIVVDVKTFTRDDSKKDELSPGVNKIVRCYVAQKRKISVGDKMAGRHGNKGVVSRILPAEDMPFLPDGRPLDIVLNPLGVPSRMNIGQVLEVHLGRAAAELGWKVMTPVFDGAHEADIRDCLKEANLPEDGKIQLRDGRTGVDFDSRVTVGYMYYLKLHHLVDDKIHARSTGPYSLVTQQPLGGKAQFGGQRFGEMEVWALEAYGAAYTLQEILTVKSDDVVGRVKTYESIVKGLNVPTPGVPESFKVLIKELQSLGLDVRVRDKNDEEIDLESTDEDDDASLTPADDAFNEAVVATDLEKEGFNVDPDSKENDIYADEDEEDVEGDDDDLDFDSIGLDVAKDYDDDMTDNFDE